MESEPISCDTTVNENSIITTDDDQWIINLIQNSPSSVFYNNRVDGYVF